MTFQKGNCIGLTHRDGITLNGQEDEFFLAEDMKTIPEFINDLNEGSDLKSYFSHWVRTYTRENNGKKSPLHLEKLWGDFLNIFMFDEHMHRYVQIDTRTGNKEYKLCDAGTRLEFLEILNKWNNLIDNHKFIAV